MPKVTWIIVDDGSEDGTIEIAKNLKIPFELVIEKRSLSGNLITGAAFAAWWSGVETGLILHAETKFVMKLDADVILSPNYFANLFKDLNTDELGIFGGVLTGKQREQKVYVPGPVKMYTRKGLDVVRELPIATGFDVMDEVACLRSGLRIQVVRNAKFRMNREIGHSQGLLHGRYRNGLVCRWVGYAPEYFCLHVIRYLFRAPYFLGSVWMVSGYLRTNSGPYPTELRMEHRRLQRERLIRFIQNPIKLLKDLYF
jgi:glycosyltransferase involved in cell wall biosynthesis